MLHSFDQVEMVEMVEMVITSGNSDPLLATGQCTHSVVCKCDKTQFSVYGAMCSFDTRAQ